jgi:hypothetical protein
VVAISSTNMGIKVFLFSQSRFGIRFGLKGWMTKRTVMLQWGRNNSMQPWNHSTRIQIC